MLNVVLMIAYIIVILRCILAIISLTCFVESTHYVTVYQTYISSICPIIYLLLDCLYIALFPCPFPSSCHDNIINCKNIYVYLHYMYITPWNEIANYGITGE